MVTKSSSTTLLSRFAQLFRESDADDGADTRQSEPAVPAAPSEPSLKERIARKKRNDAIKAKELNQLRVILESGRGIKRGNFTELAIPSVLVRTSGMGALERNSILDKIDGAEAHLENWWGTSTTPAPVDQSPLQRRHTGASPQATAQTAASTAPAAFIDDMDLDFTAMLGDTEPEPDRPAPRSGPATEMEEAPLSALETCLRDAALHHAEGEFSEAQQLLADMLRDTTLAPEAAEVLTFSLFDVYRCTGQQDLFDTLALDYANRFGRSPGEWFSLAEVAVPGTTEDNALESSFCELSRETTWRCPAILDRQGLADCVSRNPLGTELSFINWEALQHIDSAIDQAFASQIKVWCNSPVELHWSGMAELMAAVQMCKVSGDLTRDAAWWRIHLDLLCILQRAEAYEDMAMDYCIEFEVSPPSWEPAKCKLVQESDFPVLVEFSSTSPTGDMEEAKASHSHYAECELKGNVTDDAQRAMRTLRAASGSVGQITVSCSRLGRVDFNAASALLNWAASSDAKGCQVQFIYLPRLVLVFFEMLGLQKVANLSSGAR